jgi:hypothetical protein
MAVARTREVDEVTSVEAVVAAPVVFRYFEWGPVILGTLGASAISIVLLTFGAALGLSGVSPYPYAGLSARAIGILSATYAVLVVGVSFALGGYLAGRTRGAWAGANTVESNFRDGAHGFGVWALGVVVGSVLAVSGAAGIFKTVMQSTTSVISAGAAGAGVNPAVGGALAQLAATPTEYAIDRILAPADGAPPAGGASRGELAPAIARAFAANLQNPQLDVNDRTMLARVVVRQTGMPQADAEKRVDEAFANLKAAEQKAREATEAARKGGLIAAFAAAAILAVACAAACVGASVGGRHRDQNTLVTFFGSRRFW